MGDVLSQGGDREPSPWPRRAVIAVLMVALSVPVVRHLPHGQEAAVHRPGIASPASPAPLVAPGPVLPVAPGAAQSLPNEPGGIVGPVAPWDADLRLPVTGERPAWFWPATGQVKRIGGLPANRSGYVFIRADGGWAVQAAAATGQSCGSCTGLPLPVYFLADSAHSVTHVGTADAVAPAAGGGLWLTSYPLNTDLSTAVGTAQQVSVTGAPLGSPVRLPEGYAIDRGTDRGLLLTPVTPRDGVRTYRLWDPAAARFSRSFDGVIAASTGQIAWAARCAPLCRVHVLDSGALEMQLEMASVPSGALTVVPGTWASSDALAGFGWPAGGDSLVAELSFTSKVQVASWRPGTAQLAVAVVRPGQNPGSLIVG